MSKVRGARTRTNSFNRDITPPNRRSSESRFGRFRWPPKQKPWESNFWDSPLGAVTESGQPTLDPIERFLMMNLDDDERAIAIKQGLSTSQNLEFATFDIDFDQFRHARIRSDEFIQSNRW